VLSKLEPQNAKALFRRAHCYKTMNKWEEAMSDLQELIKENPSDEIKKDISECLKKVIETRKQQQKQADEAKKVIPKVEEVKPKEGESKKIQIEENSSDSDDTEALKKLKSKVKGKTKSIDEQTL
jgi:tetratricopeptide (TPR) repeat protein